jgi:hypothetical protein
VHKGSASLRPRFDHHTAGREPWYLLNRRFDGPENRSGGLGEEKNLFRLLGFDLNLVAIPITLTCNFSGTRKMGGGGFTLNCSDQV